MRNSFKIIVNVQKMYTKMAYNQTLDTGYTHNQSTHHTYSQQ